MNIILMMKKKLLPLIMKKKPLTKSLPLKMNKDFEKAMIAMNGTAYANRVGIKITMPKYGLSKSEYFFNKDKNVIAKGLTSIKYMSSGIAEEIITKSAKCFD